MFRGLLRNFQMNTYMQTCWPHAPENNNVKSAYVFATVRMCENR